MEPKFKIGDKVIALNNPLTNRSQPRKKGNIYDVLGVLYCPKTGKQAINITKTPTNSSLYNCNCGEEHISNGIYWTRSVHFAKLDEDSLSQAVKEENYELASLIHKSINGTK